MATAIKQFNPDAHVAVLVRSYTAELARLCPDIDEVIVYDRESSLSDAVKLLRNNSADAVFFFGHKFKLTLASFLARIPNRVGRAYFWFSFLYNKPVREHRKRAERNEADYNVRMLSAIGITAKETPLPRLDLSLLPQIQNSANGHYAVLHVTTGGSTQAWSEEHFVQVAEHLHTLSNLSIMLSGVPADHEFLFRISERMKLRGCNVHIQLTETLPELAALLAGAELVIASGTGPGHLAAALGVKTVGLFPLVRSLSKERWGFRGTSVVNLAPLIPKKSECPECKQCDCINEVTPLQVEQAIAKLTTK